MRLWRPVVIALLLIASSSLAFAQEQNGAFQGTVRDASGAVMPGVTIEARSPSAVGVNTAISDGKGEYRFPSLPPGLYELTATLAGFTPEKIPDARLQLGQIIKVDFVLKVGGVTEQVLVTAESPIIDVKQNAAAASITKETIDLLPKGRDFTSVISLAPGANDESRAGGFSIDGSSGSENRYIVDGMDTTSLRDGTNNKYGSNSGVTIVTDFLQEVQVKSSGYAAENPGATGGVVSAITKSGGNSFHGSFGSYYRNNNLQGDIRGTWRINSFDNRTAEFTYTPDDHFATWSPIGDFGGPILRDKLWFYVGSTYDRQDTQRTTIFKNSPTPYFSNTFKYWNSDNYYNFNLTSQLSNNMRLRVAGQLNPSRNRGTAPALLPNGSKFTDGSATDGFTNDSWSAITTNLTATGPLDVAKFNAKYNLTGTDNINNQYVGTFDWVVTPKLLVQVMSGYLWYDTKNPPENAGNAIVHTFSASNIGLAGVPANLQFANGYSDQVQSSNRINQDRWGRAYVNANTTLYKSWNGEHTFKAGVRFERDTNTVDRGQQQPSIAFNWNLARSTLDGRSVRGQYGYYVVSKSVVSTGAVGSNNWGFWLQDSWTVQSKLTINAGVRTEKEVVPSFRAENPGIEFGFREKIAPRIGFAYDVNGDSKWKLYGFYGKYFDITKLEMPRGSLGAEHWIQYYWTLDNPDWTSINCQEGPTGCPGTFIEQVDLRHPANVVDPALTSYFNGVPHNTLDPNLKPVQTGEMTFGADHELNRSMSVGLRYTHKWLTRTIEDTGISVPNVGEVFFITNPGFNEGGQILPPPVPPNPPAQRDYDGLELRFQKRLSDRWQLSTSYLYSRLYGNYGGLASSDENGRNSPNVDRYYDAIYMSYDDKGGKQPVLGLLGTDRPHYWKAQIAYVAPWGTSIGLDSQLQSGIPMQTQLSWKGYPVYINGRGDLGRTPAFSQFDLFLQHDVKLFKGQRINVNVNVSNLFDQKIVTSLNNTPYRDSFTGAPIVPSGQNSDPYFFAGFDPAALAAAMRASGATMRDNPLFLQPSGFENRRQIRLGIKYTF